jgi:hypothetical protein
MSEGQKPQEQPVRCWFFHAWGRWQDGESFTVDRVSDGSQVGVAVLQSRRCTRCNALAQRFVKTTAAA